MRTIGVALISAILALAVCCLSALLSHAGHRGWAAVVLVGYVALVLLWGLWWGSDRHIARTVSRANLRKIADE